MMWDGHNKNPYVRKGTFGCMLTIVITIGICGYGYHLVANLHHLIHERSHEVQHSQEVGE